MFSNEDNTFVTNIIFLEDMDASLSFSFWLLNLLTQFLLHIC
jgi:hypothetical protein